MRTTLGLLVIGLVSGLGVGTPARGAAPAPATSVFAKSNLVAWCIVPFDTAKRTPTQRAEMLQRLGLRKLAYDWRDEHVPTFEDEIIQLQKRGIEFSAFWSFRPEIVPLMAKYRVTPQFWITVPSPAGANEEERVATAAKQLQGIADKTRELGCKLGLYNHGGWGGEPANMVAVTKKLRQDGKNDHVGIVYNFHHGHDHIKDFPAVLAAMQPYLLYINLNGMNDGARPKILAIGSGQHEQAMMEAIKRSGYAGPIGILCHRDDMDAEVALKQNIDGLQKVLQKMGDAAALKTYE